MVSKWSAYDAEIQKVLLNQDNFDLGYSDLAREVLGSGATYRDIDLLRTYIRRNFGHLRSSNMSKEPKILVYDLETSLVRAEVFWTGKQYIHHSQLIDEPKIITVAYKWIGKDKVHYLTWDEKQCDKKLVEEFLVSYNAADMVIGLNNRNFDDKWINARALKHSLFVNTKVKSFDILSKTKSKFRLPSHSMKYIAEYLGVTLKQEHEGRKMWRKIQWGTPEEQKEYLKKMVDYNIGDIVSTEEIYYRIRPYVKAEMHMGVYGGNEKWTCPECGGKDVELYKTTYTASGTVQRIMRCNSDDILYKISNTSYLDHLENS